MKRVLIIKPSALGDVVQATAVLPVLRAQFREAAIAWLAFDRNAEIVTDHPLVDAVIVAKRSNDLVRQVPSLVRGLREPGFDAVIDLQGLFRSALFARVTGCPRRIGYANGREHSTRFYTETYAIPPRAVHAVDAYLALCEALGAPRLPAVTFPLPIKDRHRQRVAALLSDFAGGGPLVTICPTARWRTKCWPERHYAELADRLCGSAGARVILTGGAAESPAVARVAHEMRSPCLDLRGDLALMELAALLERSDLCVGNDSGPVHMAVAVGTRAVAIFGPTDPARTGPYGPSGTVVRGECDRMPCFRRECRRRGCLEGLSPERVARVCLDRLGEHGPG